MVVRGCGQRHLVEWDIGGERGASAMVNVVVAVGFEGVAVEVESRGSRYCG